VWATSFACRLLNSTLEFEKCVLKRLRHAEITCPNSVTSTWRWWKASIVIFESKMTSTSSNCMSLSHCKTWNKPKASPTTTEYTGESGIVWANTKVPSSSQIHISIPVLYNWFKNEASTSHFRRPRCGRSHLSEAISLVVVEEDEIRVVTELPCLIGVLVVVWLLRPEFIEMLFRLATGRVALAACQSSIRWQARSTA